MHEGKAGKGGTKRGGYHLVTPATGPHVRLAATRDMDGRGVTSATAGGQRGW